MAVAAWVLAIACFLNINTSHKAPAAPSRNMKPLSFELSQRGLGLESKKPATNHIGAIQPAIGTWQGPIQPVSIQASDRVPIIVRIPTTEPVVFVGIDDGWVQPAEMADWLVEHHLPFTLFLTDNGIKNNYGYFKSFQAAGMTIQNHTVSHSHLPKLNYYQQKAEICGAADTYQSVFGLRPTLFRPPYGEYNDNTRLAAAACGMKALVLWHAVIGTGGDVQFQSNNHLQPGDIVLMHFKADFLADAQALAKQVAQNHLQIGRLEDWLP